MVRHIATLVTTAGTVLMMGCAADPGDPTPMLIEPPGTTDLRENKTAGPEVDLQEGTEWTLWAKISAGDPHGISVDKVKDGDKLTIETLSGVAYFSGKSGWWQVLSAVYKFTAGVVPTGSIAANVTTAFSETLPGDGKNDEDAKKSKPRDAYGRELDDNLGQFAKEEGGIVICMPVAHGPMYAHGANHFTREGEAEPKSDQPVRNDSRGMKRESEMRDKCFPVTREGKTYTMKGSGVLHIYAFDRNYRDNAGSYEIKFRIERPM